LDYTRRDFGLVLPALAAAASQAQAQDGKALPSKAFEYTALDVKTNGQNQSRAVLNGQTHSGFPVELHMTTLGPGQAPHPPHHHVHEEILMLQTGRLDVMIMGKTTRVTAGSVVYVASNEEHGWKNAGAEPAQYFVIALGRDGAAA
jgi:quercetin dioxygenase-like cupin family protein